MALTTTEKAALIALGIDEAMLKGRGVAARTIKSIARAAVRVSPYVARAAVPAARTAAGVAGSLAAANPISTGLGLGLGFTQTPQGQALLEAAAERGAADRIALEQAIDERIFRATRVAENPMVQSSVKSTIKRKASKYSRAVKASMKAVKASKFGGKKGRINNPKKVFGTVNRVVSAVNKGKKVTTKGISGTIAKAARRILK
tara:strand:+ start:416 stop:1024 length:609 start_codon:yes stop_codon:yes gene_type:complete